MYLLLGTVLVASLLGSLHCVGMCGPFAMMAGASGEQRKSALFPAVAYSSGRLMTYAVVGLVSGFLGMAVNRGSSLVFGYSFSTLQQTATYLAGGLMIIVGLIALARQLGMQIKLPSIASRLQSVLKRGFQKVKSQPRLRRAFSIGALTCLMPCGWLYTFAIVAAGTASPFWGVMVMVAFWSGTVPIMFALMMGLSRIGRSFQQQIPVAMASLVILIGAFTITFRAPIAIGSETAVIKHPDDLIHQVKEIDHAQLPCCHGD